MDGIVFITTEEAVNPVTNMPLLDKSHAVSAVLPELGPFSAGSKSPLSSGRHQGSMRGELRVPQPFSRPDLEPRGQKHDHLSARTVSAGGLDRLEQTSQTCLCPLTAGLRRSSPGLCFCTCM